MDGHIRAVADDIRITRIRNTVYCSANFVRNSVKKIKEKTPVNCRGLFVCKQILKGGRSNGHENIIALIVYVYIVFMKFGYNKYIYKASCRDDSGHFRGEP